MSQTCTRPRSAGTASSRLSAEMAAARCAAGSAHGLTAADPAAAAAAAATTAGGVGRPNTRSSGLSRPTANTSTRGTGLNIGRYRKWVRSGDAKPNADGLKLLSGSGVRARGSLQVPSDTSHSRRVPVAVSTYSRRVASAGNAIAATASGWGRCPVTGLGSVAHGISRTSAPVRASHTRSDRRSVAVTSSLPSVLRATRSISPTCRSRVVPIRATAPAGSGSPCRSARGVWAAAGSVAAAASARATGIRGKALIVTPGNPSLGPGWRSPARNVSLSRTRPPSAEPQAHPPGRRGGRESSGKLTAGQVGCSGGSASPTPCPGIALNVTSAAATNRRR